MKKYCLLIFVSVFSTHVNAQITLTSTTSTPQIGDSFDYIITPTYTFDVSQSGANQTWDFSSATGTLDTVSVIDLSSSSEPSTFPLANFVFVSTNTTGESYISSSTSGYSVEGLYSPGVARLIYTNKQETINYPITYNDVFNETFSGTNENIIAVLTLTDLELQ